MEIAISRLWDVNVGIWNKNVTQVNVCLRLWSSLFPCESSESWKLMDCNTGNCFYVYQGYFQTELLLLFICLGLFFSLKRKPSVREMACFRHRVSKSKQVCFIKIYSL